MLQARGDPLAPYSWNSKQQVLLKFQLEVSYFRDLIIMIGKLFLKYSNYVAPSGHSLTTTTTKTRKTRTTRTITKIFKNREIDSKIRGKKLLAKSGAYYVLVYFFHLFFILLSHFHLRKKWCTNSAKALTFKC